MISIIIPTHNHESSIAETIRHLQQQAYTRLLKEIIVVDGGSSDNTVVEAEAAGAKVLFSIRQNLAAQLNLGVEYATGSVVYFLTPGSLPGKNFTNDIVRAIQKGYSSGAFRVQYEYKHWLLKAASYLARTRKNFVNLDNQGLFAMKELLLKTGSFREDLLILEDLDITKRLRRYSEFVILNTSLITSSKKYKDGKILRRHIGRFLAQAMNGMGYKQETILRAYQLILGRSKSAAPSTANADARVAVNA